MVYPKPCHNHNISPKRDITKAGSCLLWYHKTFKVAGNNTRNSNTARRTWHHAMVGYRVGLQ